MNNVAAISMGTNIEPRLEYLMQAVGLIDSHDEINVMSVSSVYETAPVGYVDQDSFLNIVVFIETTLSPKELLIRTQNVENTLGRERLIRWGPRTIDLDILLYNKENIKTDELEIPHPRMSERAFVGIPFVEAFDSLDVEYQKQLSVPSLHLDEEGICIFKKVDWER